jgi:hypothetical protein
MSTVMMQFLLLTVPQIHFGNTNTVVFLSEGPGLQSRLTPAIPTGLIVVRLSHPSLNLIFEPKINL